MSKSMEWNKSFEGIIRHYSESDSSAEDIINSLGFNGFINKDDVVLPEKKELKTYLVRFTPDDMMSISDKTCFNQAIDLCQEAIDKAGGKK